MENHTHGPNQWAKDSKILTAETIAALNARIAAIIPSAAEAFVRTELFQSLSEAGRHEALGRLVRGIAEGFAKFYESNASKLNGY